MKKMISNIKTLAALLMAGAAFNACSSSDEITTEQPQKPTEQQVYTLVIKATKGGDAQTRALALDGTTLNAYWSGDEKIEVVQDGVKIGTATAAASANGETTITATLTSTPTSSDLLFYLGGSNYDYTGQVGLLTGTGGISEKYDYTYAVLYTGNFTVVGNNINLTGDNPKLNFENTEQAVVKFNLMDKGNGNAPISATKLNIHDSKADGLYNSHNFLTNAWNYGDVTITPGSGTSEIYAALAGVYNSNLTLTARAGDNVFSYSKANASFNYGKYYNVNVKMNKILAKLNSTSAPAVLGGGYKTITPDEAKELAKECWTVAGVAGNYVYVVYAISGSGLSVNVSYASYDGTTAATSTAGVAELSALYNGTSTAWFVEPAVTPPTLASVFDDGATVLVKANTKIGDPNDWYGVTGTYNESTSEYATTSCGSSSWYTPNTVSMTKDGNNLVVFMQYNYNQITITFNTTNNTYRAIATSSPAPAAINTFTTLIVNGVDITSTLTAVPSETITLTGGENTYSGTHFQVTGKGNESSITVNQWKNMVISAKTGKTIVDVVFSYTVDMNLDALTFSSGTFNGSNMVENVNATSLTVGSTSPVGTPFNGVTIYYSE